MCRTSSKERRHAKADANQTIKELSIDRKCQRLANALGSTQTIRTLIEDDLETAEQYKQTTATRKGIIESNTLYKSSNTLTIALDSLKKEWTEFEQKYKESKNEKIDYESLPEKIRTLKSTRKAIIDRATNAH